MADLSKIVDELSSLTVLEAAELSKLLEEKWGVSAAAPVAVAAAGPAAAAAAPVPIRVRPAARCMTLGRLDLMRLPNPAARMTAAKE